jgi:hypothetical protein
MHSNLRKEELHGLDVDRFQELIIGESVAGKGTLSPKPEELSKWLIQCGMDEKVVQAMKPAELVELMQKALGDGARVIPGFGDSKLPEMKPAELDGLDLKKFRDRLIADATKNGGAIGTEPETLKKWLLEDGMKEERVKAMKPNELVEFMQKALGDGARVTPEFAAGDFELPEMKPEELDGLNLKKFHDRLLEEGAKSGGTLKSPPDTLKKWLVEDGMKEERVKAMSQGEVAQFISKVFGGKARVSSDPGGKPARSGGAPSDTELGGLDVNQFKSRLAAEAAKHEGHFEPTAEDAVKWLAECGMSEARLKALRDAGVTDFVKAVIGSGPSKPAGEDLAGLDLEKLKKRVMEEAMKTGGKLSLNPGGIARLLRDAGMKEEAVKDLKEEKMRELLQRALGGSATMSGAGNTPTKEEKIIIDQDKEMLAAVKPSLEKVAPSMVSLGDGDKTLALGTIVRENGFILT